MPSLSSYTDEARHRIVECKNTSFDCGVCLNFCLSVTLYIYHLLAVCLFLLHWLQCVTSFYAVNVLISNAKSNWQFKFSIHYKISVKNIHLLNYLVMQSLLWLLYKHEKMNKENVEIDECFFAISVTSQPSQLTPVFPFLSHF